VDWQLLIVGLLVVLAAAYLGRRAWRTWSASKGGCGGGCHCPDKNRTAAKEPSVTLIPVEQLHRRRR
jgi:hypothetical protein